MKQFFEKALECLVVILPFLRRKDTREMTEFTELIIAQYGFLAEQLEKALKDYFELSIKVKEMHAELFALKEELGKALAKKCEVEKCNQRM